MNSITDGPNLSIWVELSRACSTPCPTTGMTGVEDSDEEPPFGGFRLAPERKFRWAVMSIHEIPESTDKTYADQLELLPAGFKSPSALGALTAML